MAREHGVPEAVTGAIRAGTEPAFTADAGVLRRDVTAGDHYCADVAKGFALRDLPTPSREDYDRRIRLLLRPCSRRRTRAGRAVKILPIPSLARPGNRTH
jgi:hypothetical protein